MRKQTFRQAFMQAAKSAKDNGHGAFYIVGYLKADFPKESQALEDALREEKEARRRGEVQAFMAGFPVGA